MNMNEQQMTEIVKDYSIVIRGPRRDMSDVLRIARVKGREILKVKRVRVKPIIYPHGNDYVVIVEPEGVQNYSKLSTIGERKKTKK